MRKSLWSPDEDEKLRCYVAAHGCGNWSDVAKQTGLQRCGKSCRLRWINYLRPDLKRGPFSAHEVRLVVNLHNSLGNSWSKIATHLPGRTDNDVKNFWHSYTRSRRMQQQQQQQAENNRKREEASIKGVDKSLSKSQMHYCGSGSEDDMIKRADAAQYAEHFLQVLSSEGQARRGTKESLDSFHGAAQGRHNPYKPTAPYHNFSPLSQKTSRPITLSDLAKRVSLSYTNQSDSHLHLPANQPSCPELPHIVSDHGRLSITRDLHTAQASISALHKDYSPSILHNQTPMSKVPGSGSLVTYPGGNLGAHNTTVKDELAADFIKYPDGLESVLWSFLKGQTIEAGAAGAAAEYTAGHAYCNAGDEISASRFQDYSNPSIKAQLLAPNSSLAADHYPNYQLVPSDQYINIVEPLSDYASPDNKGYMHPHFLADCLS